MAGSHTEGANYLNCEKGIWSWLTTIDHKRIGVMYFFTVMSMFMLGGFFAIALRTELITPNELFMSDDMYNRSMTLHGAIMVFMVIIPGVPAILGNFFLPIMVGAKDVAFPKVNLLSWYCLMAGILLGLASLFMGGIDTGWTFYTPYSIKSAGAVSTMILAAFIMGMSSILTGLNFIVTVHKLRAPGMSMMRMPLFIWSLYSTAIIQILSTPVVAITLALVMVERIMGIGIFDSSLGGDPVLFQHLFWFYSHPAVYIMILPAMGIISEVISTFSQKPIFGYKTLVGSTMSIAILSFFVWGHHMFTSGQSELVGKIFSFLTMLVGVPTAIKLLNWTATLYKAKIRLDAPMLYALSFMFLFTIGGLTGLFLATMATDIHLHDTYFVVAHFHYVMVGGVFTAMMAGFFYWFPKITGKTYEELPARISAYLVFIGFNATFLPQFVMGSLGMPRRYHIYDVEFQVFHIWSTFGSYIIAAGFLLAVFTLIKSIFTGKDAGKNPWNSTTLEWTIDSPPIHENFIETPIVTGRPYDYK